MPVEGDVRLRAVACARVRAACGGVGGWGWGGLGGQMDMGQMEPNRSSVCVRACEGTRACAPNLLAMAG